MTLIRFVAVLMTVVLLSASCAGVPSEPDSGGTSFERAALTGDFETANQTALQAENRIQDFIVTCMKKSGFDYWRLDQAREAEYASRMQTIMRREVSFPADGADAAARGFGIADALIIARDSGLMDGSPEVPGMSENEEYVAGLSNNEREAYSYEMGVCQGSALKTVDSTYATLDALSEIERAVSQRLALNDNYIDLVSAWLTCMRTEGLLDPQVPVDEPREFLMFVQQDLIGSISNTDAAAIDNELEALRASEIDLAKVVLECGADAQFFADVSEIRGVELEAELERRGL